MLKRPGLKLQAWLVPGVQTMSGEICLFSPPSPLCVGFILSLALPVRSCLMGMGAMGRGNNLLFFSGFCGSPGLESHWPILSHMPIAESITMTRRDALIGLALIMYLKLEGRGDLSLQSTQIPLKSLAFKSGLTFLALRLFSCVIMGKSLNVSEPQL